LEEIMKRTPFILLVFPILVMEPAAARAQAGVSEAELGASAKASPEQGGWGITGYPILFYSPETKTAFGGGAALYKARPSLRPDVTEVEIFGTQTRQFELNLKQTTFLSGNRYELFGELRLNRSPSMVFFGVGADNSGAQREEYLDRGLSLAPHFAIQVWPDVFLGPAVRIAAYSAGRLAPGGLLDQGAVPGGLEELAVGAGFTTRWETTDSPFFPTRGFRSEATALLYRKRFGSDHDFAQLMLSHRHFIGFGDHRVLAFQVMSTFSTGTVPWQMVPRLGGMSMLRGYYEGRYRERHFVAAQAEYRFPIYWRLSSALFVAAGEVAGRVTDLTSNPIRASAGGGLRILLDKEEHINLRADIAVTLAGSADFYIALMEAF
jgi:hypothetical protein